MSLKSLLQQGFSQPIFCRYWSNSNLSTLFVRTLFTFKKKGYYHDILQSCACFVSSLYLFPSLTSLFVRQWQGLESKWRFLRKSRKEREQLLVCLFLAPCFADLSQGALVSKRSLSTYPIREKNETILIVIFCHRVPSLFAWQSY